MAFAGSLRPVRDCRAAVRGYALGAIPATGGPYTRRSTFGKIRHTGIRHGDDMARELDGLLLGLARDVPTSAAPTTLGE
jgi:hypothetical protein